MGNKEKIKEILLKEQQIGTWRTLALYSMGQAENTLVRLRDGRVVDLQYTIDIGWSSGLSEKTNYEGWKAGWQFYPFSGVKLKDIIDSQY